MNSKILIMMMNDDDDQNLNRVRQPTIPHPIIPDLIFNDHSNLTIYFQDALTFDFSTHGKNYWRIIGNLPYHISSLPTESIYP
jgi:hypothetical protein